MRRLYKKQNHRLRLRFLPVWIKANVPAVCPLGLKCPLKSGMVNYQVQREGIGMAQKKISEILKLVEFLNEEVKEVSKRLSRVTPKEVSEKLGTLALVREKILNLQVDLPQDMEKKLSELYPALNKVKPK